MKLIINNQEIVLKEAVTFWQKLIGLMGQKNIKEALSFSKCNGIHTFFMREAIDVILTDKDNHILYLYPNMKPWRILFPKKNVYYTYELPKNSITNLKMTDKLKMKP